MGPHAPDAAAEDDPAALAELADRAIATGRHGDAAMLLDRLLALSRAPRSLVDRAVVDRAVTALRMYDLAGLDALAGRGGYLGEPYEQRFDLLRRIGAALLGDARAASRVTATVEAALARPLPIDELRFLADAAALALARLGRRDDLLEAVLRIAGTAGELGADDVLGSLLVAEAAYRSRSDLMGARRVAARAVEIARTTGRARDLPFALAQLAPAQAGLGDAEAVDTAAALEAFGAPAATGTARYARALLAQTVGDTAVAIAEYRALHLQFVGDLTAPISWHAELVTLLGDDDGPFRDEVIADLRMRTEAGGIPWLVATRDRLDAAVETDLDRAAVHTGRAVERFEAGGYAISAARAALAFADRVAGDRPDLATPFLRFAHERFTAAGMTRWAERAGQFG